MKCPFCQGIIDDDSRYCDLCGKHLMFCPQCRQPKKGTSCPRCGEPLVSAEKFFGPEASDPQKPEAPGSAEPKQPEMFDFGSIFNALITLNGEGMVLHVRDGEFGRDGGIFPELGNCKYVSGHHGKIAFMDNEWKICDLGSTNGTAIDGVRLEKDKWYSLRKGQKLRIATLHFTVE